MSGGEAVAECGDAAFEPVRESFLGGLDEEAVAPSQ
jgi:hypothetical protein